MIELTLKIVLGAFAGAYGLMYAVRSYKAGKRKAAFWSAIAAFAGPLAIAAQITLQNMG